MSTMRILLPLAVTLLCCGCGLRVPEIQDFGDSTDGELFVEEMVANINCEITEAVKYVVEEDIKLSKRTHTPRRAPWLEDWGAQTTLQLTLDEKGGINPTAVWMPPSPTSAVFSLGASATLSSEANRVDKLTSYNTVKEFLAVKECKRPNGPFLLQSDLGLREWLVDVILGVNTGVISFPSGDSFKNNVISHEIKFDVVSAGGLVPGWKLTRVSVGQSGNGLTLSRERTHDLTITLGPTGAPVVVGETVVKNSEGKAVRVPVYAHGPSQMALDSHLASQIGSAVASAVKGALQP